MLLRNGFGLLEVVLSLAISSILALVLLQSTSQMNKIYQKVAAVSAIDRSLTLIQQQFDRDFSGIFMPEITLETEQPREDGADTTEKKAQEAKTDTQKEEPKEVRLPHAFFSKNDGVGNCVQLTCITTNPVAVYNQVSPRMVRVVYTLEPDIHNPETFVLLRQQSDQLDFKKFTQEGSGAVRKYMVADGIQSCKIDFMIPKPKEEKKETDTGTDQSDDKKDEKDEKEKKEVKREFVPIQEWQELKEEDRKKEKLPLLPAFIHVILTLVDQQKRSTAFELWYAPLYDAQPCMVEDINTLPSKQELYHRRFAEHKAREQYELHDSMMQAARGVGR